MTKRTNLSGCSIIAVFLLGMVSIAGGRTISVDDDGPAGFNNIQAAIDDSGHGDIIVVNPGTYTGPGNRDIDFHGKAITVRSENGPDNCIIDCNATITNLHRGFHFHSNEGPSSVIRGFTITRGYADGSGGGVYCDSSDPTITNCNFVRNMASGSGGGIYNSQSHPIITNCTFTNNGTYPIGFGGGIHNYYYSSPTVIRCKFEGNYSALYGGGMGNAVYSSPLVINCVFIRNFRSGGGMFNTNYCNPTVVNCPFIGNQTGGVGAGMYNGVDSNPMVINCTFTGNLSDRDGGGMYNRSSSRPTLTNCILWGNTASSGPQIYNYDETSSATVSYSDVQGGWPGIGNINADPLFLDPAIGEYHLLPGSPCIDAGYNSAVPPSVVTDLDGNPRIIDGTVDMGAYEGPYRGFLLSAESVVVPEGGTATFTVAPMVDPLGMVEVTVAVESGDPDITVESGGLLTFDSTNYSQPQTVTLAAAEDGDQVHGATVILVSAPGVYPAGVTAYELDREGPTVLYVDCNALGANDGSSWENAFTELREGLSFAAETFWVKEIRVAQGVYRPAAKYTPPQPPQPPGGSSSDQEVDIMVYDREATFQLINGVAIYGGYAGVGEPDPNERDIDTYETILSGDIRMPGDISDNSYHVVTGSGTDETALLDGFTITAGNANGSYTELYDRGGGMYNDSGSPTVINCTFTGNSANRDGGGMFNSEQGNPTLTNCTFTDNSAIYDGGAMCNRTSSPTVTNCKFNGNSANHGGGISNRPGSPTVTNCTFSSNSAELGGAVFNWDSSPLLANCIFSKNSAREWGGAICNLNASSPTLANCTFNGNSAMAGGGVYNQESSPTLTNCILWDDRPQEVYLAMGATAVITYSDVQGGWPGEGNMDIDPCFVQQEHFGPISYWKFDEGDG
ncbi:MAG TPA: hypothetical protein HPP66_14740, partial [Planctomycetes bacterium]|nr:hypothetical protein [Planctomycetota bacterium]